MTLKQVMAELQSFGDEQIKSILLRHGAKEPLFGVRVGDLKTIQKKIKKDDRLARELYATGNADAMYLAGLIAEDEKMTKEDLNTWIRVARSNNICEYTVPWVAAGSPQGYAVALEWIDSKEEHIAAAGWATLSSIVALLPDAKLDLDKLKSLLKRVAAEIHKAPNRVRYTMNGFITAVGAYVTPLTKDAIAASKKIGVVTIDMGDTSCEAPDPIAAIGKIEARGALGKKKKTVKC